MSEIDTTALLENAENEARQKQSQLSSANKEADAALAAKLASGKQNKLLKKAMREEEVHLNIICLLWERSVFLKGGLMFSVNTTLVY